VLAVSIIVFSILIFPLFISVKACIIFNDKKLYFTLQLFGFIKLLGGYVELGKDGLIIHLSKNKAIIIEKKNLLSVGKKFKPLKDYHVIKFVFLLEIGAKNRELIALESAFIVNYISEIAKWIIYNKKPYVNYSGNVNMYQDTDNINIFIDTVFLLNLLMILLSLIKIIWEKMIYALSRRKQQNKQSN